MNTRTDDLVVVRETCVEPEGTFEREVRLCEISFEKLKYLYEKQKEFKVLFNDFIGNDPQAFVDAFIEVDDKENVTLKGLIWEVDDVGIIFLTDLIEGWQAEVHASFWDRRFKGREKLFLKAIQFFMHSFDLHRVRMEIPLYAQPAMGAIERVGFKKEGRMREAILYDGKWFDVNLYSLLRSEVDTLCQ